MTTTPHGQVPEALRLANSIDPLTRKGLDNQACGAAAAELRRLHGYCQELEAQVIRDCMIHVQNPADSVLEDAAQESDYRRGYRHGYEQRDAEVRGALA